MFLASLGKAGRPEEQLVTEMLQGCCILYLTEMAVQSFSLGLEIQSLSLKQAVGPATEMLLPCLPLSR